MNIHDKAAPYWGTRAVLVAEHISATNTTLPHPVRLLQREGLTCLVVGIGRDDLDRAASYGADLVMVQLSGAAAHRAEALVRIRTVFRCPVVLLSERRDDSEALAAFDAGLDDVWFADTSEQVLLARLRVRLRHADSAAWHRPPHSNSSIRVGNLTIDRDGALVRHGTSAIALSPSQVEALHLLATRAGHIVTRLQLSHGTGARVGGRAVDALVSRLRTRLTQAGVTGIEIDGVPGRGYRLWVQAGIAEIGRSTPVRSLEQSAVEA
jgi:DNA-binding response OmpR family regulator